MERQNVSARQGIVGRAQTVEHVQWLPLRSILVIGQKIQMLVFCLLAVVCAAQIQILLLLLQFIQAPAFAFLATEVLHVFHALLAGTRQVRV